MRKSGVFVLLFLIVGMCFSEMAYAQLNSKKIRRNNKAASNFKGQKRAFTKQQQYSMVGMSINALNYFGEMAPSSQILSTDISFTRPGISIWGAHRIGTRYTAEVAYSWGTVSGSDFSSADPTKDPAVYRYIRNLSFRNRINELSAVLVVDLYENQSSYISRVQITPYLYVGVAGFHHNPQAKVNENSTLPEAGQWVDLKPLGTEGQQSDDYDFKPYSSFQFSIPLGIGVRYRLNQILDFSFQIGMRFLFFDYIDDVSGNYVDLGTFGSNNLARELSDRSQEATSSKTNEPRDFTIIGQFTGNQTYLGSDGILYDVFAGYGSDTNPNNIRGNSADDDFILVTQIRVAYILGGSFRRAKYR